MCIRDSGKRKTLALRWAERRRGSGMHPIRLLDAEQYAALRAYRGSAPPLAEDWLAIEGPEQPRPWIFDPMQGASWLKNIDRVERWMHSAMGGG